MEHMLVNASQRRTHMDSLLQAELQSKEESIVDMVNQAKEIHRVFCEGQVKIQQAVEVYRHVRMRLLEEILRDEGLMYCTWGRCTKQRQFSRERRPRFIFTEGRSRHSCGYEDSGFEYRSFAQLHRVCQRCAQRMLIRSGERGAYDHLAEDQSSFNAFPAKKRKDGFYVCRSGVWQKLPDVVCVVGEPPENLVNSFMSGRDFPPRIEFVRDSWGRVGALTVHRTNHAIKE